MQVIRMRYELRARCCPIKLEARCHENIFALQSDGAAHRSIASQQLGHFGVAYAQRLFIKTSL